MEFGPLYLGAHKAVDARLCTSIRQAASQMPVNVCSVISSMAWGMLVVGVGTFLLLSSGFRAPYGRCDTSFWQMQHTVR